MKEASKKINIFWTGGMDSTFRLIQVLTTTADLVQPHYIVRHEHSTGIEIDTMIQIRRILVRKFPEARSRFLPTIYTNEDLIQKFEEIDQQVTELAKSIQIREQYRIMANYCRQYNIDQIEVSIIRLTGEHEEPFEAFKDSPVFQCFTYPILEISKKESFGIAKSNNWEDILNLTSFCRRPIKKIKPCGLCGPCADAVESGMGFRFPFFSYIKARIQIPFRRYWRKNYLKQNDSKFFRLIKRKLEDKL